MIVPNKIHFCWFGSNQLSELNKRCVSSWGTYATQYEIFKWSEENILDIKSSHLRRSLREKMWAFAADYVRLSRLYEQGGIYLDTDMELIRPLDDLFASVSGEVVLCEERSGVINAAFIAAQPQSSFIKKALEYYEEILSPGDYINIPRIISAVYKEGSFEESVVVLPSEYFYPFNPYSDSGVKQLMYSDITDNTIGIHHWEKSWKKSYIQRVKEKLKIAKIK